MQGLPAGGEKAGIMQPGGALQAAAKKNRKEDKYVYFSTNAKRQRIYL